MKCPLNKLAIIGLLMLVSAALGAGITRIYWTKTVDKEVVKDRVTTVERIITAPDGTRTEERTIDEKKEDKRTITTVPKPPDWYLYVGSASSRDYAIGINRRILGPVSIGGQLSTTGQGLLTIGVEF